MRLVVRRIAPAVLLAATLGFAAVPAAAQSDTRALYDRLDRLERDIGGLQSQLSRGIAPTTVVRSPALSAPPSGGDGGVNPAMYDRVDQLEEQIRHLTGKIEEANYKAAQAVKQMERMQADIDLRFKDLAAAGAQPHAAAPQPQISMPAPGATTGNGAPVLIPPKGVNVGGNSAEGNGPAPGPQVLGSMPEKDLKKATATPQPQPAEKPKDAQGAYDEAYRALETQNYAGAEAGFRAFLQQYPSHQLAGNASYWLGESSFVRKDFGNSAVLFADAYKKHPKHPKAPDMLYKLGASFSQLGKTKEACKAYHLVLSEHPDMPDRLKRQVSSERQKLSCQ
jgi:tol-pal system protein YbgF